MWLLGTVLYGCTTDKKQTLEKKEIETIDFLFEKSSPKIHITNVQPKHLEVMLDAYRELEAYYGKELASNITVIRFKGQSSPWVPEEEKHYCVDSKHPDSTAQEHVYYFANHCRSYSTLLRETNKVLYSYIDIQTCDDLCACMIEEQISLRFGKDNLDCKKYCGSTNWEHVCTEFPKLKTCCRKK